MPEKVLIKCKGNIDLPFDSLMEYQGNLKNLSDERYEELKANLLRLGFSEPCSIWQHDGKNHILNGHQRIKALKRMKDEGIIIPEKIPCSIVEAKNKKEAKEKVYALASQYGEATKETVIEFAKEAGLTFDDIQGYPFPGVEITAGDFIDDSYKQTFGDAAETFIKENGLPIKKEKLWLFCIFDDEKTFNQVREYLCPKNSRQIDVKKLRGLCIKSKKKK